MKNLAVSLVINGISLYLISILFSGIMIYPEALITMTIIFCILNSFIKPILHFLAFPITVMTLGLFSLIINGVVLYWAFGVVSGAYCDSLLTCVLASIVLSILNTAITSFVSD